MVGLPGTEGGTMYAQTNIQLFNQLQHEGYSNAELRLIRDAYELAIQLFTGLYRPSGKTFIAHVVGTASVLSTLHAPAKVIAAALVHAAYDHGDFGEETKGISAGKREQVRRAVGKEVEEYIARYTTLPWNPKTIPAVYDGFHALGPIDRDVLLTRLANELDDLLDLGVLYCFSAERKRQHYIQFSPLMIEMAEKLGFPTLAVELTRVLRETASTEIPAELRSRRRGVILLSPRSYRRRLWVVLRPELSRGLPRLRSTFGVRKRFSQLIHRISRLHSAVGVSTKN